VKDGKIGAAEELVFFPCNNPSLMSICIYCIKKYSEENESAKNVPFVLHVVLHFRFAINSHSEGRTEGETTAAKLDKLSGITRTVNGFFLS